MPAEIKITLDGDEPDAPAPVPPPVPDAPFVPTPLPVPTPPVPPRRPADDDSAAFTPPTPPRRSDDSSDFVPSPVPAFDRPIPVVVMGPNPLPVTMAEGGGRGPAAPREPKEKSEPGWVKFLFDRAASAARSTGVAAVGVAQNRAMPAVMEGLSAAASGLARLGPAGLAAAAGLTAVGTAAGAFVATVDAFVARGRELAGLNAQLAGASAYADVTRMMADIREANELGPQMAQLIENQAKTETTVRELLLPIKSFMLDVLNDGLETGLEILVSMLEAARDIAEAARAGPGLLGKLSVMIARIRDIMEGGAPDDLIGRWLNDLGGFVAPPAPAAAPPARPFGLPAGR